jgi:hypothetical protein
MSERAIKFLESWLRGYMRDGAAEPETAAWECFADALKIGIGKDEIRTAAGGALTAFIRDAILRKNAL